MSVQMTPGGTEQATVSVYRKGRVLRTVIIVIVCFWMFILGVLVGRGTSPVRFNVPLLQEELSALKAAVIQETKKRYAIAFKEVDKQVDLGFHEELRKDPKGDVSAPVPLPAESVPAPSASTEPAAPDGPVPVATALPPEKKAEMSEQKALAPDTDKTPEENPAKGWGLQVAATQEEAYGNQVVARLKKLGYRAYLTSAPVAGKGTWYRIRVGGYASREAANADMEKLKTEHYSPFLINP